MALARDSSGGHYNGGPVTSDTWSFTNTAGNTMFACAFAGNASDLVTGITYNGVSLTKIGSVTVNSTSWVSMWYLKSPATGANNIVTSTSSGTDIETQVITYSGGNTSTQPDSSNTGTASGNITTSTTVVASNCWLVSCARSASSGPMTASTGVNFTVASPSAFRMGDSNGTVGTGSQSQSYTGSGNSGMIIASVNPAGVVATANPAFFINFL